MTYDITKLSEQEISQKLAEYQTKMQGLLNGNIACKLLVTYSTTGLSFSTPTGIVKGASALKEYYPIFNNEELKRLKEQIRYTLRRFTNNTGNNDFGYYLTEEQTLEVIALVNQANEIGAEEAKRFIEHYDENKAAFGRELERICLANKKGKRETKQIVQEALRRYPSKIRIARGHIELHVDVDGTTTFHNLGEAMQLYVLQQRENTNEVLKRSAIAGYCNEVVKNLLIFANHLVEGNPIPTGHPSSLKRKATYGTLASFNETVDALHAANCAEFDHQFSDVYDFVKYRSKIAERPADYVDAALIGFCRLYVSLGMQDYFPYDVAEKKKTGYCREIVEDYGSDPANAFRLLFDNVEQTIASA